MKKILIFVFSLVLLSQLVLAITPAEIGDWWGTVTIDGTANNYGAVVDAYINGEKVASDIVGTPDSGYYLIHVPGEIGNNITFKVYGITASENISWGNESYELDLSVNKLIDGSSCEYDEACSGGYCCSGVCQSTPCSTTSPTTGGGPGGSVLNSYWKCGEWSECSNESIQTRICEDLKGYEENRTETRDCIPEFIPEQEQGNEASDTNPQNLFITMTGAVIGKLGKGGTSLAAVFAFLIIAGIVAMSVNKKKEIKNN